jgi:D-sedoheptulose 7-phosphate isomerase
MKNFFKKRNSEIIKYFNEIEVDKLIQFKELITKTKKFGGKVIICGNGGSSATASHFSVDLSLNAKIQSINFNEPDMITCFANDFGYKNWLKKALEIHSDPRDLLILLSCSGNSMNLVNANLYAKKSGLKVVTLTGCKKSNKLNNLKNDLNIWINSEKYNLIEIIHHAILLNLIDSIMEDKNF